MITNESSQLFPFTSLSEYLIVVLPYAEVRDEVQLLKKDFFKSYGAYSGQNSCAHIPVLSFFQSDTREEKILETIQEVLNGFSSFELFLNGFVFDSLTRTASIDILNKQSLKDVYHAIRLALFNELISLAFLNKNYNPVMNIGSHLTPLQFIEAIRDYKGKPYTNNFRIGQLHVLKRKAPFKTWESLTVLPLAKREGELLDLI